MTSLRLGVHVSKKHLPRVIDELGLTVVQLFHGSPRSWAVPRPLTAEESSFWRSLSVPVYIHSSYLFNPASTNDEVREKTASALTAHTAAGASLGAQGLVVHGGHASGGTVREAVANWKRTLSTVELGVPLLIENTAGGTAAPGRTLEGLKRLWDALEEHAPKLCLDTCHAWAGNLLTPGAPAEEAFPELLEKLQQAGITVGLVHLNGSQDAQGSGRDHHSNLTTSNFSLETAAEVVRLSGAPAILETPGPLTVVAKELTLLRQHLSTSAEKK